MIHVPHFIEEVIEPVLGKLATVHINMCSPAAKKLMIGTGIQESLLTYMKQLGGPALGLFQVEPPTLNDQYENFLDFPKNAKLREVVDSFEIPSMTRRENIVSNMLYGCAIARIKYWRSPSPMPHEDDLQGLAVYWKSIYNTPKGAGKPEEFVANYKKYIGDL